MVVVPDDGAVEEFSTDRSDPPFGERVRDRCSDWRLEDFEAFGSEDLVEGVDELAAAVAYECAGAVEVFGVAQEQVARCLGGPQPGRVRGDAGVEHAAGFDVDEEQHVVAAKGGGVDGEEVGCDRSLGAQKPGPGDRRTFGCRVDAIILEDLPDGRGGEVWPRPTSSPWMRRCPQVGFSRASRTIRRRSSIAVGVLPGLR